MRTATLYVGVDCECCRHWGVNGVCHIKSVRSHSEPSLSPTRRTILNVGEIKRKTRRQLSDISRGVQSQKAVSAHFVSEQILPFGFAEQSCATDIIVRAVRRAK